MPPPSPLPPLPPRLGAADRLVQGDQRVGNGEDAPVFVRDGAALAGRARGAGSADGPVAEERAAGDGRGGSHGHGQGGGPGDEVGDRAAPADLRAGADAGGPADGLVVRQRAVADGEDCVAEEGDVRDGAAGTEAAGEAAARAADGLIVAELAVADGEGAGIVHDGAAEAGCG